jgi:hypothetical protein
VRETIDKRETHGRERGKERRDAEREREPYAVQSFAFSSADDGNRHGNRLYRGVSGVGFRVLSGFQTGYIGISPAVPIL